MILDLSWSLGIIMGCKQRVWHCQGSVFHLVISPILDPENDDSPEGAILHLSPHFKLHLIAMMFTQACANLQGAILYIWFLIFFTKSLFHWVVNYCSFIIDNKYIIYFIPMILCWYRISQWGGQVLAKIKYYIWYMCVPEGKDRSERTLYLHGTRMVIWNLAVCRNIFIVILIIIEALLRLPNNTQHKNPWCTLSWVLQGYQIVHNTKNPRGFTCTFCMLCWGPTAQILKSRFGPEFRRLGQIWVTICVGFGLLWTSLISSSSCLIHELWGPRDINKKTFSFVLVPSIHPAPVGITL